MKIQSDKEKHFLQILDQHKSMLVRVCYMYTSPQVGFDDIYQETLLNLWRGLDTFRGEASVSTWVYRVALNTCITWHRRWDVKRHAELALDSCPETMLIECDDSESQHRIKLLYTMISQLNPFDRALIMLWLDEKDYNEIAEILGISRANVAVRLHRIKSQLRKNKDKDI